MVEEYKKIKQILKDAKIDSISDLSTLHVDSQNRLFEREYLWVKDISSIIENQFNYVNNSLRTLEGQYFLAENMNDKNSNSLAKYACIFPKRTIISSGDLFLDMSGTEEGEVCLDERNAAIDINLLYKIFWLHPLLENGLAFISPLTRTYDVGGSSISEGILAGDGQKKIAQLDDCGTSQANLVDNICVGLPWLLNARIEDYVEIVSKYETEFENYNHYLSKISKIATSGEEYTRQFVYDFKESQTDMVIALQKKQRELKTKGITTAISICLTAIPLILPNLNSVIDPKILSSLLGGSSIKELIGLSSNINDITNYGRDNPFWVLWKWSKTK